MIALLLLCSSAQAQITNPNVFFYEPDPPQADRAFLLNVRVNPCLHGTLFMAEDAWDRELVVLPGRIEITMLYLHNLRMCAGTQPLRATDSYRSGPRRHLRADHLWKRLLSPR